MKTKIYSIICHLLISINKNKKGKIVTAVMLLLLLANSVSAQDPNLPATNLGMANVFDGMSGKPGFIYQGYAQVFQTDKVYNAQGNDAHSDMKVNSIVQINQFIYQTPLKVLGGEMAFMLMVPVVQINASNPSGFSPSVNPGVLGDITQGTAVQWSGKKLFGKPFSHRAEVDVSIPVGTYSEKYNINPSSHAFTFSAYHAFTLMLSDKVSISSRNQFNYNTEMRGQKAKAGAFYNCNYSVDYAVLPNLRIEAAAYFLAQINQDTYDGNKHFYQQQFGINDTRERVLGVGPGIAFFAKSGVLIEAKSFFEMAGKNRVVGYRPTLRIAIPLN